MARDLPNLSYIKLESGNILHKARMLIEGSPPGLAGVFGGNSGIFLPEEMAAGCCGTMPACYMPEVFRKTWDTVREGDPEAALDDFTPYSRLAAFEKDLCNRCAWKELLVRRGVIACGAVREPRPAFADAWQIDRFLKLAARLGLC
jgi:4-hydroxy-tetrahydrodipicolinate synthase